MVQVLSAGESLGKSAVEPPAGILPRREGGVRGFFGDRRRSRRDAPVRNHEPYRVQTVGASLLYRVQTVGASLLYRVQTVGASLHIGPVLTTGPVLPLRPPTSNGPSGP